MMSPKNWLFLLCLYVLYLVLGMYVFQRLECPEEIAARRRLYDRDMNATDKLDTIRAKLGEKDRDDLDQIVKWWYPDRHLYNESEVCVKWNYYNSFFFSFTAVTTIGYGHIYPVSNNGRLVCVLYCLIGVPLNAVLVGSLGAFFGVKVNKIKQKLHNAGGLGCELEDLHVVSRVLLEGSLWILLGVSVFMLLPAAFFYYMEGDPDGWDYTDSVYYTFITLSTIGFGDMVAGKRIHLAEEAKYMERYSGVEMMCYDVFIIVWIILGMGYIFMIVSVLAHALKSTGKPVARVFKGMKNIPVSDYWRKIIGELVIIKTGDEDNRSLMDGSVRVESEPCLGDLDVEGMYSKTAFRRAKSTGDLAELLTSVSVSPAVSGKDMLRSVQSLVDRREHKSDIQVPDTIEELNEDTITSLREFLVAAKLGAGDPAEFLANNIPGITPSTAIPGMTQSTAPTRQLSRKTSMDRTYSVPNEANPNPGFDPSRRPTMTIDPSQPGVDGRPTRRRSTVRLGRRPSNVSSRSGSSWQSSGSAVSHLLENTTLAEFLKAAENVRKKSIEEFQPETVPETKERKLSWPRSRKESKGSPLPQLPRVTSHSKNNDKVPLMRGTPTTLTPSGSLATVKDSCDSETGDIELNRQRKCSAGGDSSVKCSAGGDSSVIVEDGKTSKFTMTVLKGSEERVENGTDALEL